MIEIKAHGITELRKELGAIDVASQRALDTAIKVEAFRMLRVLRDQVRKGEPGGRNYSAQLSHIARYTKAGKLRKNQAPLSRLARLLRYNIDYSSGALSVSFGFVTDGPRRLSESWKSLLRKHQEGVDVLYSGSRTELGIRMARIGGRLKRAGDADARYFFLRRTTGRRLKIPTRPMIDPFWGQQGSAAFTNIRANFRRKMAGQRI